MIAGAIYNPFPPHSRIGPNQASAVNTLRALILAENNYAVQNPDTGFACKLSEFSEQNTGAVNSVHLSDWLFESGTKSGYRYEIRCPQDGSRRAARYTITAVPTKPGDTGKLAFCTDQSGEIRYSESGFAAECLAIGKHVKLD